ncbi:hypothetical protein ABEV54_18250 [Peribacillus psychrosaccharolyticus]|uniref:hypothetical protein n=1 Tax=Peribacillus psychrosaccharolyticus TaxID=1407 RepID=UPI003D29543D
MAVNHWEVNFGDVEELVEKLKRIPGGSERVINDVLHKKGIAQSIEDIQPEIPISKWKNRIRKKKHARNIKNPQASKKSNLAFTIRPKPKYNYLKYPDLGIGKSEKKAPIHFMRKGLQRATPKIMRELNERIDEEINQTLGG